MEDIQLIRRKSHKNNTLILSITIGLMILVCGVSYAFFAYSKTGQYTHTITGGKLGVNYSESTGNNITIANAYPLKDEEALTKGLEFEFSVTGYNESDENVYYAIEIVHGENVTGKNRFLDSDMKLSFYENDQLIFENKIYNNLNKEVLDYGYIMPGTDEDSPITNTYKLRIWINDSVLISNTPDTIDTTGKSVYSSDEFMNSYANFKININAGILKGDIPLVNYELNGGTGVVNATVVGKKITSTEPIREGYKFIGWATSATATEADYVKGDTYSGEAITLYAVWREIRFLYDTAETSLSSYLLADDGDARIISGSKTQLTNNYVWYSGKLWRIVALNNDGSIKLVTEENMTTITWGNSAVYEGSWMYQWLNEDFLDTLYNYENLLVTDYKWNATETTATTKPSKTTMVEGAVGLLNVYEYVQSYSRLGTDSTAYSTGYLANSYSEWLLTPYDSSQVWYVTNNSYVGENSYTYRYSIRPAINLKANVEIRCSNCDGSKTNPYTIMDDIKNPSNGDNLNTRVSGEYVSFNDELYRIVNVENEKTKITKVNYVTDENGDFVTKATSKIYTCENDGCWSYYLNNTWRNNIDSRYKKMITPGTWYLGVVDEGENYKNAICATTNTTETTKDCTKTSKVYNGYIGLGRIGEMFASQLSEGVDLNRVMRLITPYSSPYVWIISNLGDANNFAETEVALSARPDFYLMQETLILDFDGDGNFGTGLKDDPYEISLGAVVGKDMDYTGNPQELVELLSSDGEIYYSTDTELNDDNYNIVGTTDIPTAVNSGTYKIYYYFLGNSLFPKKAGSVISTISKLTPTITLSASKVYVTEGRTSNFTVTSNVPGTISVISSDTSNVTIVEGDGASLTPNEATTVVVAGSTWSDINYTVTIIFTPNDTDSYEGVTLTVPVTVLLD